MNLTKQAGFFVPAGSAAVKIRMRISIGWHFADWTNSIFRFDSCHTALTTENSAGETEDYDVIIGGATDMGQLTDNAVIRIYPNPCTDYILIDYKGEKDATIELIDISGKTAYSCLKSLKGNNRIEIPNLKDGLYIIKIIAGERIFYQMVTVIDKD